MSSPVAAAAARAAVSAAASLGVTATEPVVLADGANVIVHLRPSPVVAKVAASIPAFLARPQTLLSDADVSALNDDFSQLAETLARSSADGQALHGDAGIGNLMAAYGQWIWHDFEDTCSGPVAWDLAATTASPRLDASRILAAYGDPVDPEQLRTCQQLRRLALIIWYALYAERLPDCRQRATDLLTAWRASWSL